MTNKRILGLLGIAARARKVVSGADACLEEMKTKKIGFLIVSEEASDKTKKNYLFYAEKYNIPIAIYGEIDQLSKAIGKKNKAIIGVKDINLAKEIEKIINGGDIIG